MYRQIGIRFFILIDRITQFIYRVTDGRVGEVQGKVHMLLLHSIGRKTGKVRTHCLQYQRDGQNYLIIASNFGLPKPPAWYLNLRAHPRIKIQVGRQHLEVNAHTATPEERKRLWPIVTKNHPPYAEYQAATTREIPVVILTPLNEYKDNPLRRGEGFEATVSVENHGRGPIFIYLPTSPYPVWWKSTRYVIGTINKVDYTASIDVRPFDGRYFMHLSPEVVQQANLKPGDKVYVTMKPNAFLYAMLEGFEKDDEE